MNLVLMDGTGNRFYVLDAFCEPLPSSETLPALAQTLCAHNSPVQAGRGDRIHRVDGLLIIEPADGFAGRMRVFNADGSIAEMCGNGLRCVAKLLQDRYHVGDSFMVATDAGPRQIEVTSASTALSEVRTSLGRPIFEPERIPTTLHGTPPVEEPLDVEGETWFFTCVSMGNPHAVTFVDDPEAIAVDRIGRAVEHHAAFPKRTNVEFASVVSPRTIRLRVWERGVGETAACGTGAAATAVAAIRTGRAQRNVTLRLAGGELQVGWPHDKAEVSLSGPARTVDLVAWNDRSLA